VLELTRVEAEWPTDTDHHGLRLHVEARKPPALTITSAHMWLESPALWSALEAKYGGFVIAGVRAVALPLPLSKLLPLQEVRAGERLTSFCISLGTGLAGSQRVSHRTIRDLLKYLVGMTS
jgi:hypothetical protein